MEMVKSFKELSPEFQASAGGKGAMLAKMFQSGYPVPDGFVILPSAFQDEKLTQEAWIEAQAYISTIRKSNADTSFAIRSSASSEDSAGASFAGEFETVLNVKTDEEILAAIHTVFASRQSGRVKAYSSAHGMTESHQIAIVIQIMIQPEISGVLFTVDPITGSFSSMIGNYVFGLGEQLVSGESDAYTFDLTRPKGKYNGPDAFSKYAKELYRNAAKLEKEFASPQDIEWATAKGKLYILQARPITNLKPGNLDTYEINESFADDTVWVNTNVGEAIPDVSTPLSWSIIRSIDIESNYIPGYYLWSGNICGRTYSNLGRRLSAQTALFGWDAQTALEKAVGELFGNIPKDLDIPVYPFERWKLLSKMLPNAWRYVRETIKAYRNLPRYLKDNPDRCLKMADRIKDVKTANELLLIWKNELRPYISEAWWAHAAGSSNAMLVLTLRKRLAGMVGDEDAGTLLSNLRGDEVLASLGPVVGISKVAKGEISREEYLQSYGHRSPHEFELSIPVPAEDDTWLEKQVKEFGRMGIDTDKLLQQQRARYDDAFRRFCKRYPRKIKWLEKKALKAAEGARSREAVRSEMVRVLRIVRCFALKAGELMGMGDDIFFFYIHEIEHLLAGKAQKTEYIPKRKENYEKFRSMPPFPSIIRGRFDPAEWLKNPDRRMDFYDGAATVEVKSDSDMLRGFPGSPGRVEGIVRILDKPEDGETLKPGEILVAATTNVGWTPIFPKAAAVITNVGAPLSHAAIVARELGVPAVVGCGNATAKLKTGDRVYVDGGQGIVQILKT